MSGGAERTAHESDSLGRHPVSTVALTFPNGPDSSLDAYRRRRYFTVSIPLPRFNAAAHSPKVVSVPLHSGHKHTMTVQRSSLFSLSAALIYIQIAIPNHFFLFFLLLFFAAIFLQARKTNGVGFYDLNIFFCFCIVYFPSSF